MRLTTFQIYSHLSGPFLAHDVHPRLSAFGLLRRWTVGTPTPPSAAGLPNKRRPPPPPHATSAP